MSGTFDILTYKTGNTSFISTKLCQCLSVFVNSMLTDQDSSDITTIQVKPWALSSVEYIFTHDENIFTRFRLCYLFMSAPLSLNNTSKIM